MKKLFPPDQSVMFAQRVAHILERRSAAPERTLARIAAAYQLLEVSCAMAPIPPAPSGGPLVTPFEGDLLRFWVRSQSGHQPYLVDLMAYNMHGGCDCPDFLCRNAPRLREPGNAGKRFYCKHLRLARDFGLDHIIEAVAKRRVCDCEEEERT